MATSSRISFRSVLIIVTLCLAAAVLCSGYVYRACRHFVDGLSSENTEIKIYGRVVDQYSGGTPDVAVNILIYQRHEKPFQPDAVKSFQLKTDSNGEFDFTEGYGVLAEIHIAKPGYAVSPDTPPTINFLTDARTRSVGSTSQKRMVIEVWKRGSFEQVTAYDHEYALVPDGRTYTIDLLAKTISEGKTDGDLRVQMSRPPVLQHNKPYKWTCSITAINGGIVVARDPFLFLAPPEGYEETFDLIEAPNDPGWSISPTERLYLRLRKNLYGALQIQILPQFGDNEALLDMSYWVSPTGSRNLEHNIRLH
jgi:hypothetical protein